VHPDGLGLPLVRVNVARWAVEVVDPSHRHRAGGRELAAVLPGVLGRGGTVDVFVRPMDDTAFPGLGAALDGVTGTLDAGVGLDGGGHQTAACCARAAPA
jgi:hypothetical protein